MQIILPSSSRSNSPSLDRARLIAQMLDSAFRVPGTRFRFGFDSIIGLIPGVGDLIGLVLGGYILRVAAEHNAPRVVRWRMAMNLWIDSVLGAIPFLGDLFDVGFKAHQRNVRLLEEAIDDPERARRSSQRVIGGLILASVAILAGVVALVLWALGVL
jgi:hypothetical protein